MLSTAINNNNNDNINSEQYANQNDVQ